MVAGRVQKRIELEITSNGLESKSWAMLIIYPARLLFLKGYVFKNPIWVEEQTTFERVSAITLVRSHTYICGGDGKTKENPREKAFTQRIEREEERRRLKPRGPKRLLKLYPRSML